MDRLRASLAAVVLSALVGCDATTPMELDATPEALRPFTDLAIRAPRITRETLVEHVYEDGAGPSPAEGPAAAEWEYADDLLSLTSPSSGSLFRDDVAMVQAAHYHTGTYTSVAVQAHVVFGERIIGSHTRTTSATNYLATPFRPRYFAGRNSVGISQTCGLTVSGGAQHYSSMRIPSGSGELEFMERQATSAASPKSQPECNVQVERSAARGPLGPEELVCWYRVWYDLLTGEVLHWERLHCTGGGEGPE